MTYHMHGFNDWTPDSEISDSLVDAIATCILHNRWGGGYIPPAFAILNAADNVVANIAALLDFSIQLDCILNEAFITEQINKGMATVPPDKKEKWTAMFVELTRRVMQQMGVWGLNLKDKQRREDVERLHEVTKTGCVDPEGYEKALKTLEEPND